MLIAPSSIRPKLSVSSCPILLQLPSFTLASCKRNLATLPTDTLQLNYDLHISDNAKAHPENPPILFLHGLFGNKANNRAISKQLSRDLARPIYALDLRNHGASPHSRTHDYLHLAADIHAFMHTHKLANPTLIGHSMGAKAVMALALAKPADIQDVIAVDNAPVDAALKTDFHIYVQGMREITRKGVVKKSEADRILEPYAPSLPVRQFLLTNLVYPEDGSHNLVWRIPLDTLAAQLDAMGDFPFKNPDETSFKGRMLMVRGTKSPYVADEALPIIGRFFPRFEVVDIESGHWVISENPEAFRKAVVEFLRTDE